MCSIGDSGTRSSRTSPIIKVEDGFRIEKKFLLQQNPELAKVFPNVQHYSQKDKKKKGICSDLEPIQYESYHGVNVQL